MFVPTTTMLVRSYHVTRLVLPCRPVINPAAKIAVQVAVTVVSQDSFIV